MARPRNKGVFQTSAIATVFLHEIDARLHDVLMSHLIESPPCRCQNLHCLRPYVRYENCLFSSNSTGIVVACEGRPPCRQKEVQLKSTLHPCSMFGLLLDASEEKCFSLILFTRMSHTLQYQAYRYFQFRLIIGISQVTRTRIYLISFSLATLSGCIVLAPTTRAIYVRQYDFSVPTKPIATSDRLHKRELQRHVRHTETTEECADSMCHMQVSPSASTNGNASER